MNFLGLGPGELLLVLVLALIVFGPDKLPEIGQGLGRAVREFRRATSQLTEEFQREIQLEAQPRRVQTPPIETPLQEPALAEQPVILDSPVDEPPVEGTPPPRRRRKPRVVATPGQSELASEARGASEQAGPNGEVAQSEAVPKPRRARKPKVSLAEPAPQAETDTPAGEV